MPNVLATARYILKKAGKMVQHRLQLLCYYSQGWSLACDDEELFPEEFEAWVNGPVCRELFEFLDSKNVGWNEFSYRIIRKKDVIGELTEDQCNLIDNVLEVYNPLSTYQLEYVVHRERPYRKVREGYQDYEACKEIIPKEEMLYFYRSMQEEEEELPVGAEVTD